MGLQVKTMHKIKKNICINIVHNGVNISIIKDMLRTIPMKRPPCVTTFIISKMMRETDDLVLAALAKGKNIKIGEPNKNCNTDKEVDFSTIKTTRNPDKSRVSH